MPNSMHSRSFLSSLYCGNITTVFPMFFCFKKTFSALIFGSGEIKKTASQISGVSDMVSPFQQEEKYRLSRHRTCSVKVIPSPVSHGYSGPMRDLYDAAASAGTEFDGDQQNVRKEDCLGLGSLEISTYDKTVGFSSASVCGSQRRHCGENGSNPGNNADVTHSAVLSSIGRNHTEIANGDVEVYHTERSPSDLSLVSTAKTMGGSSNGDTQTLREKPIKRAFCAKCEKAQGVCICKRFKGIVQNKVRITILQNPKEKQHAVGSARVALLGLENVDSVTVPELYTAETFRIRPKVPGSKRCLSGRGGKKLLLNGGKIPVSVHDNRLSDVELVQVRDLLNQIFKQQLDSDNDLELLMRASPSLKHEPSFLDGSIERFNSPNGEECMVSEDEFSNRHLHVASNFIDSGLFCLQDLEALIPPGVGLLFPSEKAIELSDLPLNGENHESQVPSHLLVLDGTWSKAKRIYFENPWLKTIPHFKLSPSSPSLYEGVRKQPKSGYLSTLESIIYALKILEPDIIEGLDNLLEVFNSMLDDQRLYKQLKHLPRDH